MKDPYEGRKVINSIRAGILAFLSDNGPGLSSREWVTVAQQEEETLASEVVTRNQRIVDAIYDAGDAINMAQSVLIADEVLSAASRTAVAGALEGVAQIMGRVKEEVLDLELANEVAEHAVEAYERSVSGEELRDMAKANIADAVTAGREAMRLAGEAGSGEEADAAARAAREGLANAEVSMAYLEDQKGKADMAVEDAQHRVTQARAVLQAILKDNDGEEARQEARSTLTVAGDLAAESESVTEAICTACERVEKAVASLRMLTAQPGVDRAPYQALVEQFEEAAALYRQVVEEMGAGVL